MVERKRHTPLWLILPLFAFYIGSSSAAIYKTVDENGNVIYTDNILPGQPAEQIKLKPFTPIPAISVDTPNLESQAPQVRKKNVKPYKLLQIVDPAPGASIHNQDQFTVNVAISPGLQAGHHIRLKRNDVQVGLSSSQLSFNVTSVERGAQVLTVEILDQNKKVIKSSKSTVFVHRAIVPQIKASTTPTPPN